MFENPFEKIWVLEFNRDFDVWKYKEKENSASPSGRPDGPIELKFFILAHKWPWFGLTCPRETMSDL